MLSIPLTAAFPQPLFKLPELQTIWIGSIPVSTYPLMIGIGAIGMLVCILYRKNRFSLSVIQSVFITLLLTACGILGAKLLFMLENLKELFETGSAGNGVSFFGSVNLIPLVMPLLGKLFRLKASQTHDLCAPCVAVMIGFIRMGCMLNACCGGWVVYIGKYYFAWPTQIMECIADFLILVFLLRLEKKGKGNGMLYPIFMICYSTIRFFIEFLRYSQNKWLYLSNGHWFAIAAILAAVLWIYLKKKYTEQQTRKIGDNNE